MMMKTGWGVGLQGWGLKQGQDSGSGRVGVEFQRYCPVSIDHCDDAMSGMDGSGCCECVQFVIDS